MHDGNFVESSLKLLQETKKNLQLTNVNQDITILDKMYSSSQYSASRVSERRLTPRRTSQKKGGTWQTEIALIISPLIKILHIVI